MKKTIISLTLIITIQATSVFGAMVPMQPCQSPILNLATNHGLLASPVPISNMVTLCSANATHAIAADANGVRFVQTPQLTGTVIDISSSAIQNFLMSKGFNITLEKARLAALPKVNGFDIDNILVKIAGIFDNLAAPQKGLFRYAKTLYHHFTKSDFEKNIEHLAANAQKDKLTLRLGVQGLDGVESVFVHSPSTQDTYLAIEKLIGNISPLIFKTNACSANIFDFGLRIEQVTVPELTQVEDDEKSLKLTPTLTHAATYCGQKKDCTNSCCNGKTPCPRTRKVFLGAMDHMIQQPDITYSYRLSINERSYLNSVFSTIHQRSQLFAQNYVELFHGYDGKNGIIFDVMTEIAKHMKLFSSKNPSHFVLRLCGNFNNAPKGECSLEYWLERRSVTDLDLTTVLFKVLPMLGITKEDADKLIQEIFALYSRSPEHRTQGHLLQIFVPRQQATELVYMSYPGGRPLKANPFSGSAATTTSILDMLDAYPQQVASSFVIADNTQSRLILRPDADLTMFRYYKTSEAAEAAKILQENLARLFDRFFANHHDDGTLVAERIRAGQEDALAAGKQQLSDTTKRLSIKANICEAIAEKGPTPQQCLYIALKAALENPKNKSLIRQAAFELIEKNNLPGVNAIALNFVKQHIINWSTFEDGIKDLVFKLIDTKNPETLDFFLDFVAHHIASKNGRTAAIAKDVLFELMYVKSLPEKTKESLLALLEKNYNELRPVDQERVRDLRIVRHGWMTMPY